MQQISLSIQSCTHVANFIEQCGPKIPTSWNALLCTSGFSFYNEQPDLTLDEQSRTKAAKNVSNCLNNILLTK
uniref:Uncharacterized protein n=1 Tax=Arundo donax TaxID=35708 RepID=A0A0A9GFN7_ARUDO